MSIWKEKIDIEETIQRSKGTMVEYLGIEFIEIGDDYLKAKMPVDHRTHQPLGIMHGGASCVLAETVGSVAANYCVNQEKNYCVGLSIDTNHIRSVCSGHVIGTGRPYHLGKSTQVWGIEIRDEKDHLISINRLTVAVLNRKG